MEMESKAAIVCQHWSPQSAPWNFQLASPKKIVVIMVIAVSLLEKSCKVDMWPCDVTLKDLQLPFKVVYCCQQITHIVALALEPQI